ncbi:MAG: MFS transporter [Bacteroidota bacterium]
MNPVPSSSQSSHAEKNTALLVATFASFLTPFMGAALNVALPTIGTEFGADAILLNLTATIYLLATAIFLLPFGRLGDILGRKKIFTSGIVIFTLATVAAALSASITWLIITRVFQGLGSAMIFGTGVAILTSVFPANERGKALGINVSAVYIGLASGPFAGGLLTQYFGWRSIFWVLVPLGILVFVMVKLKLKGEWAESRGEKFDWKGGLIYSFSLMFLMFGFSRVPELSGFIFMALGVFTLFVFIRFELGLQMPLFEMRLFQANRVFVFSNLAALINYSATFAVGFLLSLYLQYVKGYTPRDAGIIMIVQPLIMAAFSPVTGRLSDRIQPQFLATTGMVLSTIGLVLLIFLGKNTSLAFIVTILAFLGAGFALFSSPNTNAIMGAVDRRYYGVASGAVGTMRMVGQMFSMGIVLLLFTLLIGKVKISPETAELFLKSMHFAFILFAGLCFVGIFASLARGKVGKMRE